jgi:hypothetical protein
VNGHLQRGRRRQRRAAEAHQHHRTENGASDRGARVPGRVRRVGHSGGREVRHQEERAGRTRPERARPGRCGRVACVAANQRVRTEIRPEQLQMTDPGGVGARSRTSSISKVEARRRRGRRGGRWGWRDLGFLVHAVVVSRAPPDGRARCTGASLPGHPMAKGRHDRSGAGTDCQRGRRRRACRWSIHQTRMSPMRPTATGWP